MRPARPLEAAPSEDLAHPNLQSPLPGRTGQALQAAVDRLAARIREREVQRELLHEAATHDRLTGLFNRATFFDHLTSDVERLSQKCRPHSVLSLPGQRPERGSSGSATGAVTGAHPIER